MSLAQPLYSLRSVDRINMGRLFRQRPLGRDLQARIPAMNKRQYVNRLALLSLRSGGAYKEF